MRGKKKGCRAEMSDSISTLGATRQDIFTKKKEEEEEAHREDCKIQTDLRLSKSVRTVQDF